MNSSNKDNGTLVRIQRICKSYSNLSVLEDISFDVKCGEILSILGPSGCGKTTLLKIICGLLLPSSGKIINGKKSFSFVFEKSMLLPWKTVLENIMLPGIINGSPDIKKAEELLNLIQLSNYERYYPEKLSCGMKQRVCIAMALATGSDIILMDEPFNSLDEITRFQLYSDLLKIMKDSSQKKKAIVFITHSVEEAAFLSDRVIILSQKPSQVKAVITTHLPRNKDKTLLKSAEFFRLENKIREHIL